jgi:hypothetical protein
MKDIALIAVLLAAPAALADKDKTWSYKADYIEACSCNLFCSCYFNAKPEGGHHCEFNNAVKFSEGHVGDTKLDGLKVWISGDLGGDFSKGEMKSAVMTFEPTITKAQQDAVMYVLGKIYPVKWQQAAVDKATILWEKNGMNAHAKLGKGEGEVTLTGVKTPDGKQSVLQNVAYWGAPKNNGFYLAKSEHHYKGHGHDYTYKDKNGFMISVEGAGTIEAKK